MVDPLTSKSTRPRWHERVEHYTPDGALGRLLFAVASGSVGVLVLLFAVFSFVSFGIPGVVGGLLAAGVGLVASLLAIVVLWPVYLSLIGNVESAREYPDTDSVARADRKDGTDPFAILQRRYAAGEISGEEFERRLDDLLSAEERPQTRGEPADRRRESNDEIVETDRN